MIIFWDIWFIMFYIGTLFWMIYEDGVYNKVLGGLSCALLLWIGGDVSKVLLEIPFYTIHQVKCQDPNFGKRPSWTLRLKHIPTNDKECKNVSSNFQHPNWIQFGNWESQMFWNFESRFKGLNLDKIGFCLNHWKVIGKKKLKSQGQIPKQDI
jgi:hypothetical protein